MSNSNLGVRLGGAFVVAALCVLSSVASAQDFPYDSFPARSVPEAYAKVPFDPAFLKRVKQSGKPGYVTDTAASKAKVAVKFLAQSRALDADRFRVVDQYFKSVLRRNDARTIVGREYLFEQAGKQYWIPAQATLEPFMAKELKTAQSVDLYLLVVGGLVKNQVSEAIALIEEFEAR
ncbi:MAG: hypothetical protein J7485_04990 [Sphingobium sp.]|nr:hypothetical protein [Sphingobium sp.]